MPAPSKGRALPAGKVQGPPPLLPAQRAPAPNPTSPRGEISATGRSLAERLAEITRRGVHGTRIQPHRAFLRRLHLPGQDPRGRDTAFAPVPGVGPRQPVDSGVVDHGEGRASGRRAVAARGFHPDEPPPPESVRGALNR
jgi:hypothetical protein